MYALVFKEQLLYKVKKSPLCSKLNAHKYLKKCVISCYSSSLRSKLVLFNLMTYTGAKLSEADNKASGNS